MSGLGAPEIILIMAALAILFLPAYLGYVAGSKRTIGGPAGLLLGLFFSYIGLIIVYILPITQPVYYDFGHRQPQSSSADEIMKYKELYDSGAITEQEYNTQKARILNSNR
ncbi:SHOCT domain-containing protein [Mucilaginibacter pallidiroseus]|uniref:SHOCT domain-containing protein n=1 Tax=Mucilaginibacter pallidiroseus TaxID=2599295 RepID=A0A563UG18_9SPHI|nr:SHOCT domain-containing protein [Mucilaginibacter pallidiroseus]TWR30304.1 SHOCT domain-containing protein [Mucilaginibacter pallidiroseus]